MQLTRDRYLYQVRYVDSCEPENTVYSLKALRGTFGSEDRTDIDVIVCDVVPVRVVPFNDLAGIVALLRQAR
jgi:hypothetical protein